MTPVTKAAAGEHRKITEPARSAGCAPALHRGAAEDRFRPGGVVLERLGQRRRDPARRYGVDPDALGGPGDGEALGELRYAALAGAVGGGEARAEEAQHRGHVDDAAAPFRQQRTAGGADAHGAGQVDVHHLGEGLQVVFGTPPDDPGGIDQNIKTVQPAGQTVDRGGVGHVKLGGRDGRGWDVGSLGGGQAGGGDVAARFRQSRRDGGADAAGAAGNQRVAARYVEHGVDPFWLFCWLADCQSSFPVQRHLPQRAFVRKGLSLCRRSNHGQNNAFAISIS